MYKKIKISKDSYILVGPIVFLHIPHGTLKSSVPLFFISLYTIIIPPIGGYFSLYGLFPCWVTATLCW